ncbi:CBS domain-containing protein, partial [Streptomyces caeruleatus]
LNLTLKELKRPTPQVILPQKMAWEAMQLMEADQKRPFMVLPVVNEGGQLQGLIKMHDILQSGMS